MEICAYEPEMAASLARHIGEATAGVPHCFPPNPEEMAAALVNVPKGEDGGRLFAMRARVAVDHGEVTGFAFIARERPEQPGVPETGIIRFLSYRRGERSTGQTLLDDALRYLAPTSPAGIAAFRPWYRFSVHHFQNSRLSDRFDHVHALFLVNGFQQEGGEVFLDWPDFEPGEPEPFGEGVDFRLAWQPGRGTRPGLSIRAFRGSDEIGECRHLSGGEFSRHPDAQDWAFCLWLGVNEPRQGNGLGRYLLRRGLYEMRKAGYRHASISTSLTNHRAFVFYSNYGYRVADWTFSWFKPSAG